jgi:hypothetical protein
MCDKQWDKFMEAWLAKVGNDINTPAARDIIWRSRSKQTPALLVKSSMTKPRPPPSEIVTSGLDFITGPEKEAALVNC